MGPLGEDLIHIVVAVLAVAVILAVTVKTFADHEIRHAKLDLYRSALITADKASTQLSWESPQSKHTRVLDTEKLKNMDCNSLCDGKKCSIIVVDQKKEEEWTCGSLDSHTPKLGKITINLPASIRTDEKNYHPGTLSLTLAR